LGRESEIDMTTRTPRGILLAHDDHGLGPEHLLLIDNQFSHWDGRFIVMCLEMPAGCPDLPSALYGPAAGDPPVQEDEVSYLKRNGRPGPSRMVGLQNRPAGNMIIVAGPGRDEPVIYTAYGTQASSASPREPWDRSMNDEEKAESEAFWADHALSEEG